MGVSEHDYTLPHFIVYVRPEFWTGLDVSLRLRRSSLTVVHSSITVIVTADIEYKYVFNFIDMCTLSITVSYTMVMMMALRQRQSQISEYI
jgi:hypothetical protein